MATIAEKRAFLSIGLALMLFTFFGRTKRITSSRNGFYRLNLKRRRYNYKNIGIYILSIVGSILFYQLFQIPIPLLLIPMVVTVSGKNYSLINACEDENQWAGGNPSDVTDFYKRGTQCIGFELWQAGNLDISITVALDLSGTKHLRCWFMTTVLNELNTDANGGMQFYVSDGVNTGYYYVSGSTTYPGGWYNPVIDLSRAVDSGTKPNMAAITTLGLRFNLTGNAKKVQSLWIDHIYTGDGLIIYGDDGGSSFDLVDVLVADENTTNGWGMIRKIGGVYYLVAEIESGDSAGVNSCDFKDLSQTIVFEDRKVNVSLYTLTVVDNGVGTTKFQLGEKSGTQGISGCVVRVQDITQNAKFDIDASDADITDFKMYGCTFLGADATTLPLNQTNNEVLNCNFEKCGEVDVSTCVVKNCNFISSPSTTTGAIMLDNISHNVTLSNFISCSRAVRFPSGSEGSYTFTSMLFTGNTVDIRNEVASGKTVTINCTGTPKSDPITHEEPNGGTTSIVNTVTLKATCKNAAGLATPGIRIRFEKVSDGSLVTEGTTNSSGVYQDNTYNYVGDLAVRVIARLKGYKFNSLQDTILSGGLSVSFTMIADKTVNLP